MVPNTSDDLPEPETPVNTVNRRLGISTLTSLRLLTRAPRMRIRSCASAACWLEAGMGSIMTQRADGRRVGIEGKPARRGRALQPARFRPQGPRRQREREADERHDDVAGVAEVGIAAADAGPRDGGAAEVDGDARVGPFLQARETGREDRDCAKDLPGAEQR